MNKKLFWACIAVLVICGALLLVFRMGDENKEIALSFVSWFLLYTLSVKKQNTL